MLEPLFNTMLTFKTEGRVDKAVIKNTKGKEVPNCRGNQMQRQKLHLGGGVPAVLGR